MKIRKPHYQREAFSKLIAESKSRREVLSKLGLKETGGNYQQIRKYITLYDLDISHFMTSHDQTANARKNNSYSFEQVFCKNSPIRTSKLKDKILKYDLLKYECEHCGIIDWQGKKLRLQVDHINGQPTDNRIENLRFLCPNCHSQTDTWCNKK